MSVTRITSIHCDGCGDWSYEDGENVSHGTSGGPIRRHLRAKGWLVNQPGGRDYCPNCRNQAAP